MLDIKFIRENADKIREAIKNKNIKLDLDELLAVDKKRVESLQYIELLSAEKNKLNDLMQMSKTDDERKTAIEQGKAVKEKLEAVRPELEVLNDKYKELLYRIPNIIHPDVPVGPDESGNVVSRKVGEPKKFDFIPKDHMEIGEALDIIDTKTAAITSGARFNYIKGEAALLQFALVQFIFHSLTDQKLIAELAKKVDNPSDKPFVPIVPPVIVKSEIMKKMDRFDPIDDRYYLEKDDSLLVGSAEHSLGPIHMNQVIEEKDLPIRYIGYSTAFRREAGSYGKDTKGILRAHQFDKLEMEAFTVPENGEAEQDLFVAIQEYIVGKLGIPYQVISICTGDMGKPDYRQIDIECWIPSQDKYRETHTSDFMTDFQARRLNTKVKRTDGKTEFVYMNDATATAVGRMLIAILENYQNEDGSVTVPEVLRKWMPGNLERICRK
jgi:seryl-tRNA synthetase